MLKNLNRRSVMSAELFFALLFLALLSMDSFAQGTVPGAPAKDVVEIETEIGVEQMKRSDVVSKPTIKPRAAYNEIKKIDPKKSVTPKAVPADGDAGKDKPVPDSSETQNGSGPEQDIVSEPAEEKPSVPAGETFPMKKIENALTDVQVVEISASLRKLIEENESLKKELDQLEQQLKTVRGQQKLESNRLNEVVMERDALKKQNENIIALGAKSDQSLADLQKQLSEKENEYSLQIVRLQTELTQALRANKPPEQLASAANPPVPSAEVPPKSGKPESKGKSKDKREAKSPEARSIAVDVASQPTVSSEDAQKQSEKVLMALDSVNREKAKLTRDEAKLHYNMGNTYFNEGDYNRAVSEYRRAVDLSPEDANAHYNLAFVSGDFLNDPVTALQHYKMYLFLNPGAEDAQVVRQKMIEAEISVKADVHFQSNIDKEVKQKKNEFNEATPF